MWLIIRHHAKRGAANGFCYVNDIVLSILELKRPPRSSMMPKPPRIKKVLYLDIDLHHGDGVSVAFHSTPSVLTLSLHLFAPLFFPSTGSLTSTGPPSPSSASYHDLNVATHEGLSSKTLLRLFHSSILPVLELYNPQAVVFQLGCDGLNEDPCGEFNFTLEGIGECLRLIMEWRQREKGRKILMLGGGGYHSANAARCWTYLSSIAVRSSFVFPSVSNFSLFLSIYVSRD
jgi:acetoin utilization deacetylase AcuC-like enzyme